MHPILNARALTALLLVVLPAVADAQPLQFTPVTSTFNPMGGATPGGGITGPALEGMSVAFVGRTATTSRGIYVMPVGGTASEVVRDGSPLPGGDGTFSGFTTSPSLDNGRVAFYADTSKGQGIFTNMGGILTAVAGPGIVVMPGGTHSTSRWGRLPSLRDGVVGFSSDPSFIWSEGVFSWTPSDGIRIVANRSTQLPGSSSPGAGDFGYHPATGNNRVVFTDSSTRGVWVADADGGNLEPIVLKDQIAPSGGGLFTNVSYDFVAMDGDGVMFRGSTTVGGDGLYTTADGSLRLVADNRTTIPGSTGKFALFDEFGISGSNVAFMARDSAGKRGIYADFGPGLRRIVEVGDQLDGFTVTELAFSREGLDGNRLAFQVAFGPGRIGIYVVTAVPSPGTALAIVTLPLMTYRRRR